MVLITIEEIVKLAIMSVVIGFIFTGFYSFRPRTVYDRMRKRKFDFRDLKFSILVTAPAVVLHELAHKFVAMYYGYTATFNIWGFGLGLGMFLKLIGSPLIIIAPGFVQISELAFANDFAYRLIAFSGPAVNLILWLSSMFMLKLNKRYTTKQTAALKLTKYLNGLLFFFNMLPFGPFDGKKVFFGVPT
tara:strand:+ start:284 stop:850 length:567 start_codon:yes stop_codon:yes gene_type:complete